MRYVIILIVIVFWWFILGTSLTYLANDPIVNSLTLEGNTSYSTTDAVLINGSGNYASEASRTSFMGMVVRMFTLSIPDSLLPSGFNVFISFFNWFTLLLAIVSIYRIANPLS